MEKMDFNLVSDISTTKREKHKKIILHFFPVVCVFVFVFVSSLFSCNTCGPHPGKNPNIYDYIYWHDCIDLRQAKTPAPEPDILYFDSDDRCLCNLLERHPEGSGLHKASLTADRKDPLHEVTQGAWSLHTSDRREEEK